MLHDKTLNKNIPVPLYFQLENLILEEIENGTYPVGSMIPTEKELSQMFNISRTTVRQAIADLVQKGRLYRTKSKGTFVARPKTSQDFMRTILSYDEDVRAAGRKPSTEVLDMKVVELPQDIAAAMGQEIGAKAIYLYRKRLVDGAPFVRVETYLPYEACSFLLEHDFNKESLYDVMSTRRNTHIVKIVRTCEVRSGNTEDMEILGIKRGRPIHFFTSMGFNHEGNILEYSLARYRGDESKFRVVISRE
jgi:GntR family transcriptional regulator